MLETNPFLNITKLYFFYMRFTVHLLLEGDIKKNNIFRGRRLDKIRVEGRKCEMGEIDLDF